MMAIHISQGIFEQGLLWIHFKRYLVKVLKEEKQIWKQWVCKQPIRNCVKAIKRLFLFSGTTGVLTTCHFKFTM